jgi:hypothetical protein
MSLAEVYLPFDDEVTNLLHEHDEESTLSRTTVAPDAEELLPQRFALALGSFDIEEFRGVVHVASSLDLV